MKKIAVIFLAMILLGFLVVAQEVEGEEKVNISESVRNLSSRVNLSDLRDREIDIKIPEYIQKPTRFVFKIEQDKEIDINYFIVLVAVFVILLVIITGTIYLTPLHRKPFELFIFKLNPDFIVGGIVTLLVAISGSINMVVSDWFFSLKLYEELVSKMGWSVIILIVLIFIILFFAIRMLFGILRKKLKREEAEVSGENVRTAIDIGGVMKESMDEMAKGPKDDEWGSDYSPI